MVVSDSSPPRFSDDGARLYLGTGAAARAAGGRRRPGADRRRPLELQGPADPADAAGARAAGAQAHLPRGRPPRRQAVRAAGDARTCRTSIPATIATRALGTSDLPYRQEISWDTSYNDVYLVDLKTGKPKKMLEHWGSDADDVARREVPALLRREQRPLVHAIASPTARASTSPRSSACKFQREDHDTPDLPRPLRHRRLDRRRQVGAALRQVRHLGSQAGRHRRADGHRRRRAQAADRLPLPLARSRASRPSRRTSRCCSSANDDRTARNGFYRVAS